MYLPGVGDISTPEAYARNIAKYNQTPQGLASLAKTAKARSGSLGSLANPAQGQGVTPGSTGRAVVDAASSGRGNAITRTKFEYPAALPPISPDVAAAFGQQRRVAQRGVEDAKAYRQAATQTAQARRLSAGNEITRQSARDVNQMMSDYAAGGRAFSPMGVFQGRAQIAGGASRQQVMLEEELAQTVQELNRMVSDAERAREEANAGLEMQMAIMRSNAALEDLRNRQSIDMANWSAGLV